MNQRSTFGVNSEVKPVVSTEEQKVSPRIEVGCIWAKTSKKNEPYQSIQLKFPKSKLLELVNNASNEDVVLNLVSFKNRRKESPNHPDFRIYDEIKK